MCAIICNFGLDAGDWKQIGFLQAISMKRHTKKGLEWVNSRESLKDVLDSHYPIMVIEWMNSTSAFSVWDSPPNSHNSRLFLCS